MCGLRTVGNLQFKDSPLLVGFKPPNIRSRFNFYCWLDVITCENRK